MSTATQPIEILEIADRARGETAETITPRVRAVHQETRAEIEMLEVKLGLRPGSIRQIAAADRVSEWDVLLEISQRANAALVGSFHLKELRKSWETLGLSTDDYDREVEA